MKVIKLGSHLFVHGNVGWPRTFNDQLQSSTWSSNILKCLATLKHNKIKRPNHLLCHKSWLAFDDNFVGLGFRMCWSWLLLAYFGMLNVSITFCTKKHEVVFYNVGWLRTLDAILVYVDYELIIEPIIKLRVK